MAEKRVTQSNLCVTFSASASQLLLYVRAFFGCIGSMHFMSSAGIAGVGLTIVKVHALVKLTARAVRDL